MTKQGINIKGVSGHHWELADYSEEEAWERAVNRPSNPYELHRCQEMEVYELNTSSITGYKRQLSIRYYEGRWYLFDRESKGMEIVQCPFCHCRMFIGNQVTIE